MQRPLVGVCRGVVDAEADLAEGGAVPGFGVVGFARVLGASQLGVNAVVGVFTGRCAVAHRQLSLFVADPADQQLAVGFVGAAGDDVDHAVDRVGTPQGAARAANDFDAVDVFEQGVLHIPEHAAVQGGVDAAAVDQHQQLVGAERAETARADGPLVGVELSHVHAGHVAQQVGKVAGTGAANVLGGDHVDRGCNLAQFLQVFRCRHDLDRQQVLQVKVEVVFQLGSLSAGWRGKPQGETEQGCFGRGKAT